MLGRLALAACLARGLLSIWMGASLACLGPVVVRPMSTCFCSKAFISETRPGMSAARFFCSPRSCAMSYSCTVGRPSVSSFFHRAALGLGAVHPPDPGHMINLSWPSRMAKCPETEWWITLVRACLSWPLSVGKKLMLSSAVLDGSLNPVSSATVAITSVRQTSLSVRLPGLTTAGQCTIKGTRWPPSHASAFDPRRLALGKCPLPSNSAFFEVGPDVPLSLLQMTSVFSSRPLSRKALMIRP